MRSVNQTDKWTTLIISRGPLASAYRLDVHVVAEDHERLLTLEKKGQVRNVEPDKVAALNMFERMALRGMGLVDCRLLVVAHDVDGRDLFLNDDSGLEVIHGHAFFKMSAFGLDVEKTKGGVLRSGKSKSATNDLLHANRMDCRYSYTDTFKCRLPSRDKSDCRLTLTDISNYNRTDKSQYSRTYDDKSKDKSSYRLALTDMSNYDRTDKYQYRYSQTDDNTSKYGLSYSHTHRSKHRRSRRDMSKNYQPPTDSDKSNSSAQITTRDLMSGLLGEIGMMCDYCQQTYLTQQELMCHMRQASHPTGSTVLTVRGWSHWRDRKAYCIIIPTSVTLPKKQLVEVPVCPVCLQVFQHIADCVKHTYDSHGGITGVFQLRKVNYQRTLTIMKTIRCCTCFTSFPSVKSLLRHWHRTKHLPLVTDQYLTMCFHCRCCGHITMDYQSIREHVLNQHRQHGQGHEVVGVVRAAYMEGPTPIRRLMPFFPVHQLDIDPSLPKKFFASCQKRDSETRRGRGGQKRGLDKENVAPGREERAAKMRRVSPSVPRSEILQRTKRRRDRHRNKQRRYCWISWGSDIARFD